MGGAQRYPSRYNDRMTIWSTIAATSLLGTASSSPSTRRQGDGFRKRSTHPTGCKEQRAGDLPDGRAFKNPVQWVSEKYFASPFGRNSFIDSNRPTPLQGRIAIVTDAGRDAVDAAASCAQRDCRAGDEPVSDQQHADERCCCVRRSRVVLTPRRWRQVCGCSVDPTGLRQNHIRKRRWQKSPVTGEQLCF
jgi:hypothetical protein